MAAFAAAAVLVAAVAAVDWVAASVLAVALEYCPKTTESIRCH